MDEAVSRLVAASTDADTNSNTRSSSAVAAIALRGMQRAAAHSRAGPLATDLHPQTLQRLALALRGPGSLHAAQGLALIMGECFGVVPDPTMLQALQTPAVAAAAAEAFVEAQHAQAQSAAGAAVSDYFGTLISADNRAGCSLATVQCVCLWVLCCSAYPTEERPHSSHHGPAIPPPCTNILRASCDAVPGLPLALIAAAGCCSGNEVPSAVPLLRGGLGCCWLIFGLCELARWDGRDAPRSRAVLAAFEDGGAACLARLLPRMQGSLEADSRALPHLLGAIRFAAERWPAACDALIDAPGALQALCACARVEAHARTHGGGEPAFWALVAVFNNRPKRVAEASAASDDGGAFGRMLALAAECAAPCADREAGVSTWDENGEVSALAKEERDAAALRQPWLTEDDWVRLSQVAEGAGGALSEATRAAPAAAVAAAAATQGGAALLAAMLRPSHEDPGPESAAVAAAEIVCAALEAAAVPHAVTAGAGGAAVQQPAQLQRAVVVQLCRALDAAGAVPRLQRALLDTRSWLFGCPQYISMSMDSFARLRVAAARSIVLLLLFRRLWAAADAAEWSGGGPTPRPTPAASPIKDRSPSKPKACNSPFGACQDDGAGEGDTEEDKQAAGLAWEAFCWSPNIADHDGDPLRCPLLGLKRTLDLVTQAGEAADAAYPRGSIGGGGRAAAAACFASAAAQEDILLQLAETANECRETRPSAFAAAMTVLEALSASKRAGLESVGSKAGGEEAQGWLSLEAELREEGEAAPVVVRIAAALQPLECHSDARVVERAQSTIQQLLASASSSRVGSLQVGNAEGDSGEGGDKAAAVWAGAAQLPEPAQWDGLPRRALALTISSAPSTQGAISRLCTVASAGAAAVVDAPADEIPPPPAVRRQLGVVRSFRELESKTARLAAALEARQARDQVGV